MKRADITPGEVYSLASYRDDRQGRPIMILDTHSYQRHHRTHVVDYAGTDRLVQGDYRKSAVGLLTVKLAFDMHSGRGEEGNEPPMDVLEFRAKVEELRELVSVQAAIKALNVEAASWDDRDHLYIHNAEGEFLGTYELLTGLQMVQGPYVALTLAERQRQAQSHAYAEQAEQERVADVARYRSLAERMDKLGITGYHVADWESPHGRFEKLAFNDLALLLDLAEVGHDHLKDVS